MKKRIGAFAVGVALVGASGGWQAAFGSPGVLCLVTQCGVDGGVVTEACVDAEPIMETPGEAAGSGGALAPGECQTIKATDPCDQIAECELLAATRQTPTLGVTALAFATLALGAAGAVRLRRRSSQRS